MERGWGSRGPSRCRAGAGGAGGPSSWLRCQGLTCCVRRLLGLVALFVLLFGALQKTLLRFLDIWKRGKIASGQ